LNDVASVSADGSTYEAVSTRHYTFVELAEIYNQTRIDYIVPMPMNGRRLEEYAHFYDVHPDASMVIVDENGNPVALGMLGLRGERAWITRLGVLPGQRGHGLGHFLMETLLHTARRYGARRVQLEVIEGNQPAFRLFTRFGFIETRKLLVLRRAPTPVSLGEFAIGETRDMDVEEILETLRNRIQNDPVTASSWLDETESLMNAGSLTGFRLVSTDENEWIIYRSATFQITHIVLKAKTTQTALALLQAMHNRHQSNDTKLENLPVDSPFWAAFQHADYRVEFTRLEMARDL
jgi:ribosomal protein S18 acetylase RimI-like enzyme